MWGNNNNEMYYQVLTSDVQVAKSISACTYS